MTSWSTERSPRPSNYRSMYGVGVMTLLSGSALAGCGYVPLSGGRGPAEQIFLEPIVDVAESEGRPDASIDAGSELEYALRSAFVRQAAFTLAAEDRASLRLKIRLEAVSTALDSFAEPAVRAARYEAKVALHAELRDQKGGLCWRGQALGRADVFSPAGALETLDGALRRALQQASEDAAARLLGALVVGRHQGRGKPCLRSKR